MEGVERLVYRAWGGVVVGVLSELEVTGWLGEYGREGEWYGQGPWLTGFGVQGEAGRVLGLGLVRQEVLARVPGDSSASWSKAESPPGPVSTSQHIWKCLDAGELQQSQGLALCLSPMRGWLWHTGVSVTDWVFGPGSRHCPGSGLQKVNMAGGQTLFTLAYTCVREREERQAQVPHGKATLACEAASCGLLYKELDFP
ncbi:hypothetical protein KIL84_021943 [Mauremys mutica]|uniref:Uncharacterized protein n=1 Tax=Mauremys mutica TaxID=74926 RepID=A0A9D3XHW6_9SAUR|nr:hypothetical protein KIL84_021943 [Mauremys mutica]